MSPVFLFRNFVSSKEKTSALCSQVARTRTPFKTIKYRFKWTSAQARAFGAQGKFSQNKKEVVKPLLKFTLDAIFDKSKLRLAINGTVRNQNQKRGSDLCLLTFRNFVAHSFARLVER